ncbi:hypothetical protein VE01_07048 [Pseudogymnoascus verrucosus]|uniref:peptidyl-tRNA hydrolase n=1 Tax=Pseudogymnoascus verrucosus TaxID=342668 RepID=A0A1B8GE66_9PEZI|nr:uncharacterized protein VE01_07048 [Pseudogymnoascus verrucosus]OBT94119.1 hypothetical protein VE01_07048 [Pseudogymnoascus verrucosus]
MADRPPPSATAIIIGTAILSLITGYMIGTATSLNLLPSPFSSAPAKTRSRSDTTGYDDEEESSEEEIEAGEVLDHAPNWANGPEADKRDGLTVAAPAPTKKREVVDDNEECKLVLVVRTDLGMTKGKIAAQCGHAVLACYKSSLRTNPYLRAWERGGQAKIAVQINSEAGIEELAAKAKAAGLVAEVVCDAGRTQIAAGSMTVLGVGPGKRSLVDQVTGGLKLL